MARWLLKSEPDVFGYDDLIAAKREGWDGVRNYQARNFMREMAVGDLAIFYHSKACHSQVVTALCSESFAHPYPPVVELEVPVVRDSPICQLHAQIGVFLQAILDGEPQGKVVPPVGECAAVYGN